MKHPVKKIDIDLYNAIKELGTVFEKSWGNTALIDHHWAKMSPKTKKTLKQLTNEYK